LKDLFDRETDFMIAHYSSKKKGKKNPHKKLIDELNDITPNQRDAVVDQYMQACKVFAILSFEVSTKWRRN
jgi:hypothetical protein